MHTGALRRALGLTVLYIGLFILIVLLQFTRGPGLSETFGGFSVKATYPKSVRSATEAPPETVRLSYAGLTFEISPKSAAESLGADGAVSPLVLSGIDRLANGVKIRLTPGVVLTALADSGARDRFSLSATAVDGVTAVRLRYLPTSVRFVEKDGRRGLSSGGNSYDIGLSAGSLDAKSGILALQPGDPGLSLARVVPVQAAPSRTPSAEKFVAQAPKDPDVFKAEIAAWRDKAWSGLSAARFDAAKIAWKGADGLPAFSEKALVTYLAESLTRGTYQDALLRVRGARDAWPDRLSFLSAPYFGGLVRKMKDYEAADQAELKRLSGLIASKSPIVLEKEGLLRYLEDRSPGDLAQDTLHFVAALDPAKLTIKQTVGLVACAAEARSSLKDEGNPLKDTGAAADRLVAAVRKTASGYFLVTDDDGSSDLRLSLLAGSSLSSYGAVFAKPSYVGVGQSLVEGALGLSDAQGFLPARVLVHGAALDQKMGSLSPEDFYALVADNSYYPHEVGFVRDGVAGVWAWTCAPSLSVKVNANRYVFTANFPLGRSHFLSIYGLKPFSNIQLYDIDYSPDTEFENYDASGYLYNHSALALYLKMKHKKENEDIKLSF
jgi:hypothetical protein